MTYRVQSVDDSIRHGLSAMMALPTFCGDVSVTTSSARLFSDATTTTHSSGQTRDIVVQNTDTTNTLGVKFIAAGAADTGYTLSTCFRLQPGAVISLNIACDMSVVGVSSSGTITANCLVVDQF